MQETRQHILEILKERGQATVDDIVGALRKRRGNITAVTVRHHLARLQQDNLITAPKLRHRSSPGRPQHVYALTEKAAEHFPNNYQRLATGLINQINTQLPSESINVIMDGVAQEIAAEAQIAHAPLEERLKNVVEFLNRQGYNAECEKTERGFLLHTHNCPYHQLAITTGSLCTMDMRLITALLGGVIPRMVSRVSEGDASCTYLIPES